MAFEYRGSSFSLEESVRRGISKHVVEGDITKNNFLWYDRAATMLCAYTGSEYIVMRSLSTEEVVRLRSSEYVVRSLPHSAELFPYAQQIQAYLEKRIAHSVFASRIVKELGKVAPANDSGLAIVTNELVVPGDPIV